MTCCAPLAADTAIPIHPGGDDELTRLSRPAGQDVREATLSIPDAHCFACVRAIEMTLNGTEGVVHARMNLTSRRAVVRWRGVSSPDLVGALERAGYRAHTEDALPVGDDPLLRHLVKATAVAGFAAMNVMGMSFAVWFGAGADLRQLFHVLSGLIAVPACLYAGQTFFRSARRALRAGRLNMDVPISLGIVLTLALSLWDTARGGQWAYFDAAVSLVFLLLIGRTLDLAMRLRAQSAVLGLRKLAPQTAQRREEDGGLTTIRVDEIAVGNSLLVAAGNRFPANGEIIEGMTEIDRSIVTGEAHPQVVKPGNFVEAGALNLGRPVMIRALSRAQDSFLASIVGMLEAAEQGRSTYRHLSDRAAGLYAPTVHGLAFATLVAWVALSGDLHAAATAAIAVLIITCPCALGLAVPMVNVMAARRLFEAGILVRDGTAIERAAEIDEAAFDKTGTLTTPEPRLIMPFGGHADDLAVAAALAAHSNHPYARAILRAASEQAIGILSASNVSETPGVGLSGSVEGLRCRLESAEGDTGRRELTLFSEDAPVATFAFEERLREGAAAAVEELSHLGVRSVVLSGDNAQAVAPIASDVGLAWRAQQTPGDKVRWLTGRREAGARVLFIGDGLNDALAISTAHASIAPGSAADISRQRADFIFLRPSLEAVPLIVATSRLARRLILQNLALSAGYNLLALPLAILGLVNPIIAAVAMSASSLTVVLNAMRLAKLSRLPGPDRATLPQADTIDFAARAAS